MFSIVKAASIHGTLLSKASIFFEIKKCGNDECSICKPIRSNPDIFKELKGLPDPIPGYDNHYMSFSEVYGKETTEQ